VTDQCINVTAAVGTIRNTVDESPSSNAATDALTEALQQRANNATSLGSSPKSYPSDQPISNSPAVTTVEMLAVSATNSTNSEPAPALEGTPPSEPGVSACPRAILTSPPSDGHTSVKRAILDESGSSLQSVLKALKMQNTERITDSEVPGKYAVLTGTDSVAVARIITSIGMNCVNSTLVSLTSALEIEKRRLKEDEQNRLSQIKEGREQMALYSAARTKREDEYQREEEQLPKETEAAIARLSVREIADRNLKDVLSKPTELIGEFRDQNEFEHLIREVDRQNACEVMLHGRSSVKETYYWPIIKRLANSTGPAPKSPGRNTGLTSQEKDIAKRLVIALGYGHSRDSVLKARSYLKLLSDLREAGVTLLLLYRTKEFRTHFLRHPNQLEMILSWNQLYHPRLQELRLRAVAQADGDFSGRCDLEDQDIFHRLHIPQGVIWGDNLSDWMDTAEKDNYLATHCIEAISGKSNAHVLCHGIKGDIVANKSIYVSMIPYEGVSAKKTLGGKSPSAKLLAVSPLVSVSPGDFLGIFPGRLRYADEKPVGAIQGPVQGLWLDRSEVKGKLHWMKVAKAGEHTNVSLVWEGVNEVKGEKTFCQYWRILVMATRHIRPFDQLTRPA
jgi:hypothetical protein